MSFANKALEIINRYIPIEKEVIAIFYDEGAMTIENLLVKGDFQSLSDAIKRRGYKVEKAKYHNDLIKNATFPLKDEDVSVQFILMPTIIAIPKGKWERKIASFFISHRYNIKKDEVDINAISELNIEDKKIMKELVAKLKENGYAVE